MNRATAADIDSWIFSRKPEPKARLRLFCFPYAGAGPSIFRNWPEGVPADVEVCPIQLPGRGSRLMEPAFVQLPPLVDALAIALAPVLDQPFAFFGHSLGALVSFELARRIRRQYGVHPARMFVSAARAPQLPHRGASIHNLPEREFIAELRRLNGTPGAVLDHKELMEIMLPLLRADFALYENYQYSLEPPLNCPISAFGGMQDRRVSESDLEAWRAQTSSCFSLQMFAGDHFFLNQPLLVEAVSQELESIHSA
jgi:medium-chain acyl-[acyl-carrier-protein] hydrolase